MKKFIIHTAAAASLLATVAFAPTAALAQHRCDNPTSTIDQRACDKAAEGADALRSFVARTRTIWGLYYWHYSRRDQQSTTASATVKPASLAAADPSKVAVATLR